MEIQELKIKLLNTNYFIDNEYLDKYCELVKQNEFTKKQENKTNNHHILPKSYFKMLGLPVDNSPENLVHVLYKDHIIIHYYLCLCAKGNLKHRLANAFLHLVNRRWKYENFNPEVDLSEYQKIYEEIDRSTFYNDELRKRYSRECREKFSKLIQNLETGEVYSSAIEAELKLIGKSNSSIAISAYLFSKGVSKKALGCHWVYLEHHNNIPYTKLERDTILNNIPYKVRVDKQGNLFKPIYCIDLDKTFYNVEGINNITNRKINNILNYCTKKNFKYYLSGHYWCFLEEKEKAIELLKNEKRIAEEKAEKKRIETESKRPFYCPVICIETQQIFKSITEAQNWLGVGDVVSCLHKKQHTAGGYHWAKLEDKETQALYTNFIGKEKDFSNYKIFGKEKMIGNNKKN